MPESLTLPATIKAVPETTTCCQTAPDTINAVPETLPPPPDTINAVHGCSPCQYLTRSMPCPNFKTTACCDIAPDTIKTVPAPCCQICTSHDQCRARNLCPNTHLAAKLHLTQASPETIRCCKISPDTRSMPCPDTHLAAKLQPTRSMPCPKHSEPCSQIAPGTINAVPTLSRVHRLTTNDKTSVPTPGPHSRLRQLRT